MSGPILAFNVAQLARSASRLGEPPTSTPSWRIVAGFSLSSAAVRIGGSGIGPSSGGDTSVAGEAGTAVVIGVSGGDAAALTDGDGMAAMVCGALITGG